MRKLIEKRYHLFLDSRFVCSTTLFSCNHDQRTLGSKPTATFTVTPVAGQTNKYLLSSTSQYASHYDWDKATGTFIQAKQVDTVYFPDRGTFTVLLFVSGHSGLDSSKQTINVPNDDPAALTP